MAGKKIIIKSVATSKWLKDSKEIIVEKKNISELNITLVAGTTKFDAKTQIKNALWEFVEGVGEIWDYRITFEGGPNPQDELIFGKKVYIHTDISSKLLKGYKEIIVEKMSLDQFQLKLVEGWSKSVAKEAIITAIREFAKNAKEEMDYTIENLDNAIEDDKLVAGKKIIIKSVATSKWLKDSKEITISSSNLKK